MSDEHQVDVPQEAPVNESGAPDAPDLQSEPDPSTSPTEGAPEEDGERATAAEPVEVTDASQYFPKSDPNVIFPKFDPNAILPKFDPNAILPKFDPNAILPKFDPNAILPKFDPNAILPKFDPNAILPKFDPNAILPKFDPNAILPKFDPNAILPRFDPNAILPKFDPNAILPRFDPNAILPKFDPNAILPRFDPNAIFLKFDRLEALVERSRPRNLRARYFDYAAAWTVMEEEGIPFALVPDYETAVGLVEAPDAATRRRLLVERREDVLLSCEPILALCVSGNGPTLGSSLRKAIKALRDGHHEAAQALATNVFDRLVSDHRSGKNLRNRISAQHILEQLPHREAFFLTPVPGAHEKAYSNLPPLAGFSRHATVHQVGSLQYSEANCIHAIMLSTSLLGYWQDLW